MSKLNVDQKTIMLLLSDKKADFLIPDYQRPYAWEEEQCQKLWEDILAFAFPDDNCEKFDQDDEYYLGSIVTFRNKDNKLEVIDGQQRLTTLMLLLRAFFAKFENMQDDNSKRTREMIAQCLWKTNVFGEADLNALKINSEVATDNDKKEFLDILKDGIIDKDKNSNYAKNYYFFQKVIDKFVLDYPAYFPYFPARILGNCILLPIEAESQDTALRIFSTLNNRGLPLSDADIFKAQFYEFYRNKGEKDNFIARWKELEELCNEIFNPISGTPMDELFTRYMYYERAKQGSKSSTTEALRKFYERDKYSLLKKDETFANLDILARFWKDISIQNHERFSGAVLRKLFILNYAPNGMWTYFVSVYFMHNKDNGEKLDNKSFEDFLSKNIAFIWAYAVVTPGVNALRTPIFAEMVNIVNNIPIDFSNNRFDFEQVRIAFYNYSFSNNRPITKSMLTLWALDREGQTLLDIKTAFQIEHIFSKNHQQHDKTLINTKNLESLGNKSLLETRINIRASDYRFADKTKYYKGFQKKEGTRIKELADLAESCADFTEKDIEERNAQIIESFLSFLKANSLIATT